MFKEMIFQRRQSRLAFLFAVGWVLLLTSMPVTGFAYFQDATLGVRPAGMGGAFTAVSDDANAVLFNPAGYSAASSVQATGMYADLFSGLKPVLYDGREDRLGYSFLAAVAPVSETWGAFGASWTQFFSSVYSERTLALGYSHAVESVHALRLGVNLKFLQWQIADNEFTSAELYPTHQKNGMTADLGALVTPLPHWTCGLSVANGMPADMGMFEPDVVPMTLRVGSAYLWQGFGTMLDSVQPALDLSLRGTEWRAAAGVETWWFQQHVALRLGVASDQMTAGMGFCYTPFGSPVAVQADYAFAYPFQISDTLGSHRIGMTLAWTSPQPSVAAEPLAVPTVRAEATPAPTPAPTREPIHVSAVDYSKLQAMHFAVGKSVLTAGADLALKYLADFLSAHTNWTLHIDGYACALGTREFNQRLSEERAQAIRQRLISSYTVDAWRVSAQGHGTDNPVAANENEDGRIQNRRVELTLTDTEGKTYRFEERLEK